MAQHSDCIIYELTFISLCFIYVINIMLPFFLQMEIDDVAPLKKIRVAVDAKGSRKNWYLEKVSSSFVCKLPFQIINIVV